MQTFSTEKYAVFEKEQLERIGNFLRKTKKSMLIFKKVCLNFFGKSKLIFGEKLKKKQFGGKMHENVI